MRNIPQDGTVVDGAGHKVRGIACPAQIVHVRQMPAWGGGGARRAVSQRLRRARCGISPQDCTSNVPLGGNGAPVVARLWLPQHDQPVCART